MVLGSEIIELHEQLAATGPAQWQPIAERYLLKRVRTLRLSGESRIAGQAAASLHRSRGRVGIAEVAAQSAVSPRHLERAFQEQIGVSPKMFGKLLRLDHALAQVGEKNNWAEVAIACGYFDQSHMVRDFRALTGATPVEFMALRNVPPRP